MLGDRKLWWFRYFRAFLAANPMTYLISLVRDRPEGRQTHYSAQLDALTPLVDWTSEMKGFWQARFDHLEDLLKRMDQ